MHSRNKQTDDRSAWYCGGRRKMIGDPSTESFSKDFCKGRTQLPKKLLIMKRECNLLFQYNGTLTFLLILTSDVQYLEWYGSCVVSLEFLEYCVMHL